ncbi:PHP domain-containing protein [Actinacidiphila bryophytorum]|uniref:POLIIIAc domain-containing protein n=1 Tax=Actinacidiphila bryophytorum TaxID=1436133 RepID=A0A9W4E458_9ACTN|nr:PHP domain-containing protein [Actinacidiphila bryophytorum]MBM9438462.1 PHP domain-containing protein [Actinacidiphila bryophytorum]MBN6542545.1 PHP domain-containing protein [Actinacidiphila bryophytorum]CAG7613345.1 POLIIIAc domain-containing protein [Actinacidiphila bryophytorum]
MTPARQAGDVWGARGIDLHLHSTVSDGSLAPGRLAETASAHGVTVAACTDHDSFAGSAEFRAAFEGLGGRAVTGCEVSATWKGHEVHCLVYATSDADLVARVHSHHARRLAWFHRSVDVVAEAGLPLTRAAVESAVGPDRVPYYGVFLRLFLEAAADDPRFAGHRADDLMALQRQWFEPGRPFHVEEPARPHLVDVLGWARDAGGVPVLAHPGRVLLGAFDPRADLRTLRDAGLAGLEVWTTWHDTAQVEALAGLCAEHRMAATAGSDFHGTDVKPWATAPGRLPSGGPAADDLLARLLAA